jgi:hypothetical protein
VGVVTGPLSFLRDAHAEAEQAADAAFIAANDPAAVLRRIAAERKLVKGLARVIGGEYIDDGEPVLAEWVLTSLAEGWGWTPPS